MLGGSCDIDDENGEYTLASRTGIARNPHVCDECGHDILVGDPFAWAIWGNPTEGMGGSCRRCQFCASFADGFECIPWGGLQSALEEADWDDLKDIPVATRDELFKRFGLSIENYLP